MPRDDLLGRAIMIPYKLFKPFTLFFVIFISAILSYSSASFAQALPTASGYTLVAPAVRNVGAAYSGFTAANSSGYALSLATTTGTASGVTVTESGFATFAKSGGATFLKVPVSVASEVSSSAIGKAAGKLFIGARAVSGPLGIALTGLAIYDAYKNSGLQPCPPPDFFCKFVDQTKPLWTSPFAPCNTGYVCTLDQVSSGFISAFYRGGFDPVAYDSTTTPQGTGNQIGDSRSASICFLLGKDQFKQCYNISGVLGVSGGSLLPVQDSDLVGIPIAQMQADNSGATSKQYFDAIAATTAKLNPNGGYSVGTLTAEDMVPTGSPTTIKSVPYVAASEVVSTSTYKDANGVDQQKSISQQVVVTPSIAPGTSGASTQVIYNVGSTSTTTSTNNLANGGANAPTVSTETSSQATNPANSLPTEFPKDYNKESTQQLIQKQLEAASAPEMADQGKVLSEATSKSDTDLSQLRKDTETGQIGPGGIFSWAWTPPIGSCSAASGTVHGYSVSWDICPTVLNIKAVLGWLMGIFALISIYGELFKSGEN